MKKKENYPVYEALKKEYLKNITLFVMAVSYVMDQGYSNVESITENQIETLKGNGIMSGSFVRELVRLAKKIVSITSEPVEIIQFCQAEDVFEVECFAGKLRGFEMEKIIENQIIELRSRKKFKNDREMANYICTDLSKLVMLGLAEDDEDETVTHE